MLRQQTETDLPQILIIESLTQIAPWTTETFERCWQAGYPGWIIEQDKKIIGFIIATFNVGETHILNLCVHPDYQRKGFGKELLLHVLKEAKTRGVGIAFLEVRRSNRNAIALYQKMHFIQVAERKNYYPSTHGREDALVFAKDLGISS